MKALKRISIATAALAAFASVATAGSYAPPSTVVPLTLSPAAHDWTGWYGDAYVGHWSLGPVSNFFGVNLGYNMSNGSIVYGGEVGLFHDPVSVFTNATITGRVGVKMGANALGFARLGLSHDIGGGNFYLLGIGGQYAMSNNLYLRGEYVSESPFGGGLNSSSIRLGAGWEF